MENIFRDYRKTRGITQAQLSDILDIDQTTVSKWEHSVSYPHVKELLKIQRVLQIPDEKLLAGLRLIEKQKVQNHG